MPKKHELANQGARLASRGFRLSPRFCVERGLLADDVKAVWVQATAQDAAIQVNLMVRVASGTCLRLEPGLVPISPWPGLSPRSSLWRSVLEDALRGRI
jgi:hypothetical protein